MFPWFRSPASVSGDQSGMYKVRNVENILVCNILIRNLAKNIFVMGRQKKKKPEEYESKWDAVKELGSNEFKKEVTRGRGKPKSIESPAKMWELAIDYFKYTDDNPMYKNDFIKGGDMAGLIVRIPAMVPYTWMGFETYLLQRGIITGLDKYKSNTDNGYVEYRGVIDKIDTIMRNQKFSGAAVGAFNANIISADIGLMRKEADENARSAELKIIIEDKKD